MTTEYKIEGDIPLPQSNGAKLRAMLPKITSGKYILVSDLTYLTVYRIVSSWSCENGLSRKFIVKPADPDGKSARVWRK